MDSAILSRIYRLFIEELNAKFSYKQNFILVFRQQIGGTSATFYYWHHLPIINFAINKPKHFQAL